MQQQDLRAITKKALITRIEAGYPLDSPCDPYELISKHKISLRFVMVTALDGLYLTSETEHSINISALRPAGRQRFTSAHELGHCILGHGAHLDQDIEKVLPNQIDELAADTFARSLLMPKRAIFAGFRYLGVTPQSASDEDYLRVSAWLGVGYTTLVHQAKYLLNAITAAKHHELITVTPQAIKRRLVPEALWVGRKELWPIAPHWQNQVVHLQTGDVITGCEQVNEVFFESHDGYSVAVRPGETQGLISTGEIVYFKICRKDYSGLYQFRYLEEEGCDE